jgi:DNA adenine methylase
MKTPVSRVGNKTAILPMICAMFPPNYHRFIDVFGGSGSVLLGKPTVAPFEVYNDFDHNLTNLFHCMKTRTMATIRELGFCHLNGRADFDAIIRFFDNETFDDRYLSEEQELTQVMLEPMKAEELLEVRRVLTEDYDVRRAAMFLKKLRLSYASGGKTFASQPFDLRKLFYLIQQLQYRLSNVVIENQDFETLIRHYDRPDSLFYLDPPYLRTEEMYDVDFGWSDHVRLRELLGKIDGHFLLSYNDCEEIRELYSGYPIKQFSRVHSMAQRFKSAREASKIEYKELLICNYVLEDLERNPMAEQLTLF